MGSGGQLAIAILVMFVAMVCFFVAFHPGGVNLSGSEISNPDDLLKFLFQEYDTASATPGSSNG